MKQLIQLDIDDYFVGVTVADESPLEPGVFLIPARAIDAEVPNVPTGKRAKWQNEWIFEDIPQTIQESETYVPTYADLRVMEYPPITDYLDGIVKGNHTQVQAYIDACLAIKAKYPKS